MPRVVTSFNKAGYEKYGKQFVESWQKYWPASIGLTVFYEGDAEDFDMKTHGISWRPMDEVEHLKDYLSMLTFPIQHGIVGNQFDMWFDARQARKVFMEMHAMKNYGGKVFWIDSDCETTKTVPEDFLDRCLPDSAFCCFLGRDGWYHTESGFIGFNGDHPIASRFYKNYVNLFLSGAFLGNLFFGRPGWNDCCGFDALRHSVFGNSADFVNLAADVPKGHMHPLQITAPGEYLNHYKGNRKETRLLKPEDVRRD